MQKRLNLGYVVVRPKSALEVPVVQGGGRGETVIYHTVLYCIGIHMGALPMG